MKKVHGTKNLFAEVLGWYGALAILTAFFLISFNFISPHTVLYQVLSLTGALGIALEAYLHRAFPATALNVVYALIALIALARIVI